MDKRVAEIILNATHDAANTLSLMIPFITKNCSDEEKEKYIPEFTNHVCDLQLNIINKLYEEFPELGVIFKESVEKYGRYK